LFSEFPPQFINYSFSKNISNGDINHAISTDFIIVPAPYYLHIPGFRYVFGDNIVNIYYVFIPTFRQMFYDNKIEYDPLMFPLLGLGMNFSYNINNRIFGVSPEINITQIFVLFNFNLAYRYNINFNYNNSHEIAFTIKFMSPWTFRKFVGMF
jgi:hypothetical protein